MERPDQGRLGGTEPVRVLIPDGPCTFTMAVVRALAGSVLDPIWRRLRLA